MLVYHRNEEDMTIECEELIWDTPDSSDDSKFKYIKDHSNEFLVLDTNDLRLDSRAQGLSKSLRSPRELLQLVRINVVMKIKIKSVRLNL